MKNKLNISLYFVDLDCFGKGSSYTLDYDTCLFLFMTSLPPLVFLVTGATDLYILKVFD